MEKEAPEYNDTTVEFILEHYWELKSGQMPKVIGTFRTLSHRSQQETALVWVADLDIAMDELSSKYEGKWKEVCGHITKRRLEGIVHAFSQWQQAIIKFYLIVDENGENKYEDYKTVKKARNRLRKHMNSRNNLANVL